MNGSSANGRPSIWSVLDGIGAPAHGFPPVGEDNVEEGGGGGENEDDSASFDNLWRVLPPKTSAAARRLSGDTVIFPRRISIDATGRRVRVQTVRAWVPSTTKLLVQAMW